MQPFEVLLYTAPEGKTHIEVFFEDETFWLSQKKMAELFAVDVRTINEHLQNIFITKELEREATIRNFRIVQKEGSREVSREIDFYNLDAIPDFLQNCSEQASLGHYRPYRSRAHC